MGAVLAGLMYLGVVSLAAAAIVGVTSDESEEAVATAQEPEDPTGEAAGTSEHPAEPAAVDAGAAPTEEHPTATTKRTVTSLDETAWTTDAPSTLEELGRAWSIPREVLAKLNPKVPAQRRIKAGTMVIVDSHTLGTGFSVGPPNDGRLTRGVPLPEGKAWALPADRTRAFATAETIAALIAALEAYGERFPSAEPIQVGELSARRGGRLYGHQSHQSGRDVDIRLIRDPANDGFDAERTWFLVKTLIDGGDVIRIFLNARAQPWLRSAAEADVGGASAAQYFALIRHEPGHTIHMHIRFACPKEHKRCVPYPLTGTEAEEPEKENKLPVLPDAAANRENSKIPGLRPKGGSEAPDKKKQKDKDKNKKKNKKKKKKKKGR